MDVFRGMVEMVKVSALDDCSKIPVTNKTGTENVISSCYQKTILKLMGKQNSGKGGILDPSAGLTSAGGRVGQQWEKCLEQQIRHDESGQISWQIPEG